MSQIFKRSIVVLACAALTACDAGQKAPSVPAQSNAASSGGPAKIASAPPDLIPIGPVTDAAHILKPDEIASLKAYLTAFDARTHHELVVVTVPTLDGRDIDSYSLDLANRWGVGRGNANDGIVVLLAPSEKQVRIEVGKGLEEVLTQDYCRHVMELMGPELTKGHYFEGLMTGVKSIAEVTKASPLT